MQLTRSLLLALLGGGRRAGRRALAGALLRGRGARQQRPVGPISLLALVLEASDQRGEVGRLARAKDDVPREAELRDARGGDAERETGKEASIVSDTADVENGADLGLV